MTDPNLSELRVLVAGPPPMGYEFDEPPTMTEEAALGEEDATATSSKSQGGD